MSSLGLDSADEIQLALEDYFAELTDIYAKIKTLNAGSFAKATVLYNEALGIESNFKILKLDAFRYNATCTDPKDKVSLNKFAFSDMFLNIKVCYEELKEKKNASVQPTIVSKPAPVNKGVKVPKIEIEPFNGKIHDWPRFYSLFQALIDSNPNFSNTEKFQYLRCLVKGPAEKLIQNLVFSDSNYTVAIDSLLRAYQDQRLLANYYVKQLFEFKCLPNDSLNNLQMFLSTFKTNVDALKALKLPDLSDYVLFYKALICLDSESRQKFESELSGTAIPSFKDLMDFVQGRYKVNMLCSDSKSTVSKPYKEMKSENKSDHRSSFLGTEACEKNVRPTPQACPFCSNDHKPQYCSKLLELVPTERYTLVKQKGKCLACFGNHYLRQCKSKAQCTHCKSKFHNSLLHVDKVKEEENGEAAAVSNTSSAESSNEDKKQVLSYNEVSKNSFRPTQVLLGTAKAYLKGINGKMFPIRLVIDPGSQLSFVTQACATLLGLKCTPTNVSISGITDLKCSRPLGAAMCELKASPDSQLSLKSQVIILPKISANLPATSIDPSCVSKFSGFKLADPEWFKSGPIQFLLGCDLYPKILLDRPRVGESPWGIQTIFGLVLLGEISSPNPASYTSLLSNVDLQNSLQRFWQQEEVCCSVEDPDDVFCEEYFKSTTKRTDEGRYVVSLPLKRTGELPGPNRRSALSRLERLESRLSRDPDLREGYCKFLIEYESLSHLEVAKSESSYIIPHSCVIKESSSTTRLRVVFDCGAKAANNVSLNDVSLKGPKLQKDGGELLLLFSLFPIALTCDVKMMYRQILVDPSDRHFQHIFWRTSPNLPPAEYELRTVTYGHTSAPFLSQRVLKQLVLDEGSEFPLASKVVLNNTFMDDVLGGADDEDEALKLYHQLQGLFAKGGFELRKWCSSSSSILSQIPVEHHEKPLSLSDDDGVIKVLGLQWSSENDRFSYSFKEWSFTSSKRSVLSYIARVYDPLSWLAPSVLWGKIFIQTLWKDSMDWDEPLSEKLDMQWKKFCEELHILSKVKIPRFIPARKSSNILVGFCDASEKAYGTVFYLVCNSNGDCSTHLLVSKSRVAPLKVVSIPRLELCGALLLAKVYSWLLPFLSNIQFSEVRFFCDSTVVLGWLHTPPHLLKTYVAHRVSKIVELIDVSKFVHVRSELNSADCCSRAMFPSELLGCDLWWKGPKFLMSPLDEWHSAVEPAPLVELPELKTCLKSRRQSFTFDFVKSFLLF